jgi:hypothetical protein
LENIELNNMEKIKKIESRYEIHLPDGSIEYFDTLELAEKKIKSIRGCEYEYYFIRKDFKGKKLINKFLI